MTRLKLIRATREPSATVRQALFCFKKKETKCDYSVCVHVRTGQSLHQVCTQRDGIPMIRPLPGCHCQEHKRLSVQVSSELQLGEGGITGAELLLGGRGHRNPVIVLLSGRPGIWEKDLGTDTMSQRQRSINKLYYPLTSQTS